jgi:putative acetyltransferase
MSQVRVYVRNERPDDAAAIRDVHVVAFPTDAEACLVEAFRISNRLLVSLVAVGAGRVVGHIAFSPITVNTLHAAIGGVGLAPMAVILDYQRRGIGSQLIRAGLAACTRAGYAFAVVLGAPSYYIKFGFARASNYGLGNEYGAEDAFMVLALRPDGIPTTPGIVCYAPEFALVM